MNISWLNRGVYPLLQRIGDFQYYFAQIANYLAAICFFMALLMAVVKIFLGVTDAREQVIKITTTTVIYFVLMYLYPIAMTRLLPFAMNLGYGAVFSTQEVYAESTDVKTKLIEFNYGKPDQFYKWLGENTNNLFSTNVKVDELGNKTVSLDMNVVDKNTGYFDLNKLGLYIFALFKVGFHLMPKITLLHLDVMTLLASVLYLVGLFIVVVCICDCLINYIMCLLDYYALMGFGILTIPLSLWDGTKSYTEKLYGSIGAILIKLMVISAFMYLAVMSIMDIFVDIYVHSVTINGGGVIRIKATDVGDYIELTVTMLLQGWILHVLCQNTEKISGFLNGGSPSMSLGEAAVGMASMTATAGLAMGIGKGAIGMAGNARSVVGGAVAAGVNASRVARQSGESGGGAFARSFASSVGSNVASSVANGVMNAPGNLKGSRNSFLRAAGLSRAIGSEGYTSEGGGGASSGSGYTGSGSGGSQTQGGNGSNGGNEYDKGIFGTAARSDNGEGYASKGDEIIAKANSMGESHNYWDRQKAQGMGIVGNVMKSMNDARNERAAGNVIGNGSARAFARGIAGGVRGSVASNNNFDNSSMISSGGMKMRFERNGEAAHRAGSDSVDYKSPGNSGERIKGKDNKDYSVGGSTRNTYGNQLIDNSDTKDKV